MGEDRESRRKEMRKEKRKEGKGRKRKMEKDRDRKDIGKDKRQYNGDGSIRSRVYL